MLSSVENWSQIISRIPGEGIVAGGIAVGIGLMLWLFGRRILRPAFVVVGAATGAATGGVLGIILPIPLPEWVLPIVGAIALGLLSWAMFRFSMGVCMAIVLGLSSPLLVLAWADVRDFDIYQQKDGSGDAVEAAAQSPREPLLSDDLLSEIDELERRIRDANDLLREGRDYLEGRGRQLLDEPHPVDEAGEEPLDGEAEDVEATDWTEQLDHVAAEFGEAVKAKWNAIHPDVRRSIVLSVAAGALFGLLIGISIPYVSASILTACVGSGMMLFGGYSLANTLNAGVPEWLPDSPLNWLIIWSGATIAGIGFQWMIRARPADTAP